MFALVATLLALSVAAYPADSGLVQIHSWGNCGLCVGLQQGSHYRAPILTSCDDPTTKWMIRKTLGGTFIYSNNFCLRGGYVGSNGLFQPEDGGPVGDNVCQGDEIAAWPKPGDVHAPFKWDHFDENHFRVFGTNFCLDVIDGKLVEGTYLQIWTCYPGNQNQRFLVTLA